MKLFAALLFCGPLLATTYCVSNSGNDSSSGTATGPNCTGTVSAWQTIAKVNTQSGSLNPGDSVLFQSGGLWREELFPVSGSAGNVITYERYGTGALPIISGASVLSGFTQVGSTNVWTKTVATQPKVLIFNGTPGVLQSSVAGVASIYTWFYTGTTLSVWSAGGDPSTTYAPLEAGQRDYAVIGNPLNYVTVNGIQAQYANNSGIACFGGCNFISVINSAERANYYFGITGSNSTGNANWTVSGNVISWNGGSGVVISGTGGNSYIGSNVAYNNAWGGSWTVDPNFDAGCGFRMFGNGLMSNNIIELNTSYNNGLGPTGIWNTQGSGQSPPDEEDGGGVMFDTMGTGNIMRFNVTYNNEVGGLRVVVDTGTQVYGNSSYWNVQATEVPAYSGMGIDLDFGISGTQVYNNTLYGNRIGALVMGNVSPAKNVNNLLFQNNIVAGNSVYDLDATLGGNNDGVNGSGNIYTYNAFGAQSSSFIQWGAGSFFSTYTAWEAATGNCGTTGCSHSLQSAVSFVNAASADLRLPRAAAALTASSTGGVIGALGVVTPSLLSGKSQLSGKAEIQ